MSGSAPHDVIVVGAGGMGAALLDACARNGLRTLALEARGRLTHAQGASHSSSRGYRHTYPDPLYRRLATESAPRFEQLERESSPHAPLFSRWGATLHAPPGHPMLAGVMQAAEALGVPCERFEPGAAQPLDAVLRPPTGHVTLYEPQAGWLHGERCLEAWVRRARATGRGELALGQRVVALTEASGGWSVETACGARHWAQAVVWCAAHAPVQAALGAGEPLRGRFGGALEVRRQVELWFDLSAHQAWATRSWVPMFHLLHAEGDHHVFGIFESPHLLKACLQEPQPQRAETARALAPITSTDVRRLRQVLGRWMPALRQAPCVRGKLCWGVYAEDGEPRVGAVAQRPHLYLAQAFAGHGFKMFPMVAAHLAQVLVGEAGDVQLAARFGC